ncbi:hypothetical protein ACH49_20570 [Streptomyces leeuwenhoekii]|uniref:Uncharacterized protein n=1 Tax=Streptomyces leeuwenhoekii TaxID=1437453 RepID=A0ABR5HV33_STRLW|nr:hypothetical protein ACH49_20570 [Streptomyces leeuwenhoekii]
MAGARSVLDQLVPVVRSLAPVSWPVRLVEFPERLAEARPVVLVAAWPAVRVLVARLAEPQAQLAAAWWAAPVPEAWVVLRVQEPVVRAVPRVPEVWLARAAA